MTTIQTQNLALSPIHFMNDANDIILKSLKLIKKSFNKWQKIIFLVKHGMLS